MACASVPNLPKVDVPTISVIGGAQISGFVDFSSGAPTDCKLTFNLLAQLSPLLASMACLLNLLNLVGKLKDFFTACAELPKIPSAASDMLTAIGKLENCIPVLAPLTVAVMIKDMLSLVVNFLSCFVSQLSSILEFQANIDLSSAQGNPALLEALTCAQENAQTSMGNLMTSLQPLQPILQMISSVGGVAGISFALPDLSGACAGKDAAAVVTSLQQAIASIQEVLNALPS